MLLAGDIGGTKTTVALFSDSDLHTPLVEATFPSARYGSLEAIVRAFLAQADVEVKRASFGVAGPVVEGRASVTNLSWEMEEGQLEKALGLKAVYLLNDLESIANAVPLLEEGDLHTLNKGRPSPGGTIAVIAPGTGLGEAFLTWDGTRYAAHPSEGGHADFAPTNELEIGLLCYLLERFGHASWERVCSGIGIPNIYAYLKASGYAEEPAWFAEKLAHTEDVTPLIVTNALSTEAPCPLCVETLNAFVSVLGTEAGNLALKTLATGGVYLGGGIPPRILPALDADTFLRSFQRKGRFEELMKRMPVHVIMNPKAALLGAARHGLEAGS